MIKKKIQLDYYANNIKKCNEKNIMNCIIIYMIAFYTSGDTERKMERKLLLIRYASRIEPVGKQGTLISRKGTLSCRGREERHSETVSPK